MRIVRVHHVQITVPRGAEDAARSFYCGVLGMREVPKPEPLARRGGFWLEQGDFQVHVGVEDGFDRSITKAHVAYEVDDLAGWRRCLSDKGIVVVDGVQQPGQSRFEIRDPFGNRIEFLQPGAPQS
ncbi:MAG: VOC family protein [Candidatus Wallbacteria bacterium]|nr:VOC family protein [Candidatus Wallbacteria bacterium]